MTGAGVNSQPVLQFQPAALGVQARAKCTGLTCTLKPNDNTLALIQHLLGQLADGVHLGCCAQLPEEAQLSTVVLP